MVLKKEAVKILDIVAKEKDENVKVTLIQDLLLDLYNKGVASGRDRTISGCIDAIIQLGERHRK